jgi:hypothetical protein
MAIITRDPVLKTKRMKYIEAIGSIPYFDSDIDVEEIKWGLLLDTTHERLEIVEVSVKVESIEIYAKFTCYDNDQDVESLTNTANSYFKDTVGARLLRREFEAEEETVTFHYVIKLKDADIDEVILGTKMMEKKINQRGHWSTV